MSKKKSVSTISGTISHELRLQDEESDVTDETDAPGHDENTDNKTDACLEKHENVADTNPAKIKREKATAEIFASELALESKPKHVPPPTVEALTAVADDTPKKKKRKWPPHQRVRSLVINPIRPAYQIHQASWNHTNMSYANEPISKFTYTSSYRHK